MVRRSAGFLFAVLLLAVPAGGDDAAYPSAAAVTPLPPGAKVPSAVVRSVGGEPVDVAALVRDHGALLVFYRGGW